jgi:[acyl-carrier-protein] S-malonyltransferase
MQSYAFIFPGQGSQHPGMGRELAENFKIAAQSFEEADDALGFALSRLCFEGPEEDLKLTANTQPAILAASVAAWRVLKSESPLSPAFLAGHSLGEYSALVASGALGFADALRTVRARGSFMQDAVPVGVGTMAAILGVEPEMLLDFCHEAAQGEVVSPANYNSPGQIVIAGHTGAVGRVIEIAKARGYRKAMLLPVSAPFHCALMRPAAERLADTLEGIEVGPLAAPVVSNVEAAPNADAARVKGLLVEQVCSPVLWDASVQKMVASGVTRFVEIGPGKVLAGLVKRISKESESFNVQDSAGVKALAGGAA